MPADNGTKIGGGGTIPGGGMYGADECMGGGTIGFAANVYCARLSVVHPAAECALPIARMSDMSGSPRPLCVGS